MRRMVAIVGLALVVGFGSVAFAAGDSIKLDGSTTVGPIAKAFAEYYMAKYKDVNIQVSESGSGNGAKSLINDACDVANMSRFMKDKEFAAAAGKGIKPVAHVVALDGIAMVVHPANPVKNLTMEQIHDMYVGKITNWNEVGGPDRKIVLISRDTNSGTFETFHKLVMRKDKIVAGCERFGSNGAVRARVQKTQAAIGYVGLGFVDRSIKAVTVNNIMPSTATIVSGDYPIARPLFMFTNGYPRLGSHVYRFVTLHLTEKGQEIVETIGFIPLTKY